VSQNLRNPFSPFVPKFAISRLTSSPFPSDSSWHAVCSNGGMPLQPFPDPDTFKIIGAAMTVHTELGCGFLESVYRTALHIEFQRCSVAYRHEVKLPIAYKGHVLDLRYRVDFICFDDVIVEVKANDTITTRDEAQLLNYLKAAKIRRGLILNFGAPSLQHKRRVLG
jgi:GxxExxY protein